MINRGTNRRVAELEAALAASRERASVLAHERDQARELAARLASSEPWPAGPVALAG